MNCLRPRLLLLFALAVASCAAPPPPPPPVVIEEPPAPPVIVRPPLASLSALHKVYNQANDRLHQYQGLPRCIASGPVECNDPKVERLAVNVGQQARQSLLEVQQLRLALRIATARVAAFQTVVANLLPDAD